MAKVKKVELDIEPVTDTTSRFKVTVKLTLEFNPSEEGKRFRYYVRLYNSGVGGLTANVEPIYKFKFGSGFAKGVKVTFPHQQFIFKEERLVPSEVLDVKFTIPGQPLQEDKIRAGVLLYSGGIGQAGILVQFKTSNLKVITAELVG